jgi:hypothetical protein
MKPSTNAAITKRTTDVQRAGSAFVASRRSEASRVCPRVSMSPQPIRRPAAPATMIAGSSNVEWAVTKV